MFLSSNSDIFNIFRLHIIILWGEMGIMRWLYCSALSGSCLLNTKKKLHKNQRKFCLQLREEDNPFLIGTLCSVLSAHIREPCLAAMASDRSAAKLSEQFDLEIIWKFGEYVLHCKVSLGWDLLPHPCEIKVINTDPATGSYTDPTGLTTVPRCLWA